MKNFFKAVGKAIVYFITYFCIEFIAILGIGIVAATKIFLDLIVDGEEQDIMTMSTIAVESALEDTTLILLLSNIAVLLGFWIIFLIRKKKLYDETGVRPLPLKSVLLIIFFAICVQMILSGTMTLLPWPESWMAEYLESSADVVENTWINWISTVFVGPLVEEIVFRGLLYTRLKKGMPMLAAAVVTSLVFGVLHGTIIWASVAAVLGMLLVWFFEKYKSLTASIFLHIGNNFMAMVMVMLETNVVYWILVAGSVVGAVYAYRRIVKDAAEVSVEEKVSIDENVSSVEVKY